MQPKENRYPCHIYDIIDGNEAGRDLEETLVKEYDTGTLQIETDKLFRCLNIFYVAPMVDRKLVRCRKCGALLMHQCICDPNIYEGFEYLDDWIPVRSEEEADQLNNLLAATDLSIYPIRHLQAEGRARNWTEGEDPGQYAPKELQGKILKRYQELEAKCKQMRESTNNQTELKGAK